MTVPDVSVIIPAYNAMPYFTRCLNSLEGQTFGTDRVEIIVIDDGSTDGTAEEADRRALENPSLYRVEHHPASGGPAGPRNRGLDLARGRYVYFVDADDYLGEEALARLVAVADEEGSDVVAGRLASDSERGVGASGFEKTDLDADLFTSAAYWSISVLKLYRRSMLEEHHIRFPTEFPVLSDQPFAVLAYLRAAKISLLADYDYYWVVLRGDGGHVTLSGKASDRVDVVESMCDLLAREITDPDKRARLVARHFQLELRRVLLALPELESAAQHELVERISRLASEHVTPAVARWLTPDLRLLYHLAGRGLHEQLISAAGVDSVRDRTWRVTGSDGKAWAQLPYLGDQVVDVPDEVYDVTERMRFEHRLTACSWTGATLRLEGSIGWRGIPDDPDDRVEVLLRSRDEGASPYVVPARRTSPDTFRVDLDTLELADGNRLPDGIWDLHVQLTRGDLVRSQRCRLDEAANLLPRPFLHHEPAEVWTVASFRTPDGRVGLDVGQRKHRIKALLGDWQLTWEDESLVVQGGLDLDLDAPVALVARGSGATVAHEVSLADGRFSGRIPAPGLGPGRWTIRLRVGRPPHHQRFPVPFADDLGPRTLGHGGSGTEARPVAVQGDRLAIDVTAPGPLVEERRG